MEVSGLPLLGRSPHTPHSLGSCLYPGHSSTGRSDSACARNAELQREGMCSGVSSKMGNEASCNCYFYPTLHQNRTVQLASSSPDIPHVLVSTEPPPSGPPRWCECVGSVNNVEWSTMDPSMAEILLWGISVRRFFQPGWNKSQAQIWHIYPHKPGRGKKMRTLHEY